MILKINSIVLSLLIHLIIVFYSMHNINQSNSKVFIQKKIKIKIINQIVNTNKSEEVTKITKDKVFLSDITNKVKKNKTTKNKGSFKKRSDIKTQKQISLKDIGFKQHAHDRNMIEQSPDFVLNRQESNIIEFNTIRYQYYSFFKRIQDNLQNTWLPIRSNLRYTNLLLITINDKGKIIDIDLLEESGNKKFDYSTIQAFLKINKIVNPPRNLIKSGNFRFQWKFILN